MSAQNSDHFRKGVAQWSGNIGSAGVADAVVTTVPLASTSNLPTDTAIMITVNRVDANGKKTGNYEGIVGVVSGNNLINCIRGVEGTAQAWTGGTVVEVLHTASNINELIDGILAEHNQDGTHDTTKVVDLTTAQTLTNKTLTSPVFQGTVDGWISANETWTYVSSTTFTVSGDVTSKYQITDLIKLTQTTVKYFEISAISYASGTGLTTITVKGIGTYTLASAAITSNYYQHKFPIGLVRTKSLVRAYNNATFVVATATETQIPFNTESFDTNSEYDTSTYTFTAKKAGYYLVNVSIFYIEGTISRATLSVRLNGNYDRSIAGAIAADYSGLNFSDIIYLAVNDALTFYTLQSSGANKTVHSDQGACYVSIVEL